jgi:Fe-S cluster assembly iron-binding protein IscA
MLMLTDSAVRKFKEFLGKKIGEDCGIRIFMAGGG